LQAFLVSSMRKLKILVSLPVTVSCDSESGAIILEALQEIAGLFWFCLMRIENPPALPVTIRCDSESGTIIPKARNLLRAFLVYSTVKTESPRVLTGTVNPIFSVTTNLLDYCFY
jgi:hypothetical protein